MTTINTTNPTLLDVLTRLNPNRTGINVIGEILNETNEILDDMTWLEGNLPTGHKTTIRAGLPSATWRKLYGGVVPSKSRVVAVTDATGMLEAYAEVDKAVADLNGNTAEFRLSEAKAFIEAMNQEMAGTLFYGNTDTDPEKFMGLAPRFNDLDADNGDNIVNGGGTGSDNTSIWLVVWGPNTIHGIYPKGSQAGLIHENKGQVTLGDSTNGYYEGYRDHFKWNCGVSVRDWRYIVRIANVDVSNLTKDASGSSADIIDLMVQALEIPPSLGIGRPVFYCNKTIRSFLRRQIMNKDNVYLNLETVAGKKALTFDGVPVRRCDQILLTEEAVA